MTKDYTGHLGPMDRHHRAPPPPFNPLADGNAEARYAATTASMEHDDFYATHTREECKQEWARRYEQFKATNVPFVPKGIAPSPMQRLMGYAVSRELLIVAILRGESHPVEMAYEMGRQQTNRASKGIDHANA